jgi:hypothetical protein
MTYNGRKNPPVNYDNNKFQTWIANHGTENTLIKITHANFGFNSIIAVTEEYFKYLVDNSSSRVVAIEYPTLLIWTIQI